MKVRASVFTLKFVTNIARENDHEAYRIAINEVVVSEFCNNPAKRTRISKAQYSKLTKFSN